MSRLPRLPRAERGGAKHGGANRGESNLLVYMEIASPPAVACNDIFSVPSVCSVVSFDSGAIIETNFYDSRKTENCSCQRGDQEGD